MSERPSDAAEMLAIRCLGYLARDAERLARFLAVTGIEAQDVRQAAAEPGFLAGVLAHMLADESLLMAFAADEGVPIAEVARARDILVPHDHGLD